MCTIVANNTTAAELFKSLNDYISGKLNWSFCVSICTDGAAAMTGRLSGLTARGRLHLSVRLHLNVKAAHCVIHREMLASRKMSPEELNSILNDVIKVINHIKAHALLTRVCSSSFVRRLTQSTTEVRWLSKGRLLARVFEL